MTRVCLLLDRPPPPAPSRFLSRTFLSACLLRASKRWSTMGLTRLSSAAKTLSIASAILLIDSILSAWAFHTLPSAWPRRESRGMTAAPIVTSRNYQFISNVNCCRSLTRSTAKNPAFSACDLLLQCCGSSSLSPRPPRILPPTAYSPFVGGWASASSVRRPGWRKPRERSGGALCMVDSGGGKREPARNRALGSVVSTRFDSQK